VTELLRSILFFEEIRSACDMNSKTSILTSSLMKIWIQILETWHRACWFIWLQFYCILFLSYEHWN